MYCHGGNVPHNHRWLLFPQVIFYLVFCFVLGDVSYNHRRLLEVTNHFRCHQLYFFAALAVLLLASSGLFGEQGLSEISRKSM